MPQDVSSSIRERIKTQWERPAHSPVKWLEFETILRDILRVHGVSCPGGAICLINDALAAFTRRGHEPME